jgi:hypothetical protein
MVTDAVMCKLRVRQQGGRAWRATVQRRGSRTAVALLQRGSATPRRRWGVLPAGVCAHDGVKFVQPELWITSGAATTSACTRSEGSVRGQADPHRRREASRSGSGAAARLCRRSPRRKTALAARRHGADPDAKTRTSWNATSACSLTPSCANCVSVNTSPPAGIWCSGYPARKPLTCAGSCPGTLRATVSTRTRWPGSRWWIRPAPAVAGRRCRRGRAVRRSPGDRLHGPGRRGRHRGPVAPGDPGRTRRPRAGT